MWDYKANMSALKMMQTRLKSLCSVRGHNYEAHSVNGASDPVSEVVHQVLLLERKMKEREGKIRVVHNLERDLLSGYTGRKVLLWIMWLRYFEHKDVEAVQRELRMSRTTLYRRTLELQGLAEKYCADVS